MHTVFPFHLHGLVQQLPVHMDKHCLTTDLIGFFLCPERARKASSTPLRQIATETEALTEKKKTNKQERGSCSLPALPETMQKNT